MKSKIIIFISSILGIFGLIVFGEYSVSMEKIAYIKPQYAADFSDDRILVGASHNIFIGKIIKQLDTKNIGIGPETQFEVQIIDNIKGDLNGTVVVNQQGGYEGNVLYAVGSEDNFISDKKASKYLLQPGSTYLFVTRYSEKRQWYTLNPYPSASKLLSTDTMIDADSIKSIAITDERVQQLRAAYPKEILLDADIKNGKALNSYRSQQIPATE